MANPLRSFYGYLRGEDLQRMAPPPQPLRPRTPQEDARELERKIAFTTGSYAGGWPIQLWGGAVDQIRMGTLVTGSLAPDLYRAASGTLGADRNSAVMASVLSIAEAYPEAQVRVYRRMRGGGVPKVVPNHPLEVFFRKPHRNIPAPNLWFWVTYCKKIDGNAYFRKIYDPAGDVAEVRPICPSYIHPYTSKEASLAGVFIEFYKYEYKPGDFEEIPVEDIVHFRLGLDPIDQRVGLAPLKSVMREIYGDEEATRFSNDLLTNNAIPGTVIKVPREQMNFSKEDAEELKRDFERNQGAQNRGRPAVLTGGADISQHGFSPSDIDLAQLHRTPEERISAVLRSPAMVAGLGAGLERSTFTNVREAREMLTEMTMIPLYISDAATLDIMLLRDFSDDPDEFVAFDVSDLRALQEDEDKKYTRLDNAVRTGWITPDEARADAGFPPLPDGLGALPMAQQARSSGGAAASSPAQTAESGRPAVGAGAAPPSERSLNGRH